ncbi:type 1 fimbrial protein [Enterobacter oligotrophicus]|uniref:fimbrial protein n=1 Tax=Enterobacter TaxID=547 RepID=UPI001C013A14|nr:type 1 fimbrial protein [Enterobacter oligotrophicus]ELW1645793.1 type 1 fimbrial protein [Enterobacter oligotrophicus]MBT9426425.1 type 1 fimbrial protein [Enterobacter oligotrophicus]
MKIQYKKFLFLALLCWNVYAADGVNVSVTGNIVASPCVFNGGNSNLDVNLGNIQAINMATPGSTSDPVTFNFVFTHCPVGTRTVTASFTGTPDPVAGADYYMNSGSATNVAVAMRERASGMLKGTGSSISQNIAADRTATMPMQALVKSVSGGVAPGSISAVVMVTLQYN